MQIEVKVPALSESVSEASLVTWHKKAGDAVKRDENLIVVAPPPLRRSARGRVPNRRYDQD